MEPAFVEGAGGLRIATWEMAGPGPAGRPSLLVAHATGFSARCYRAMVEGLGDRFRVVGFDLRGHGHSATPPLTAEADGRVPAMGWELFAEDALAVIDALGLEHPAGFGHSCGGAVLLLAEQRRPGSLSGVYAFEPVVAPPEVWARMVVRGDPSAAARRRRRAFASRPAALEHLSSKPPLSSLRADVLVDYVEDGFTDLPDGTVGLRCAPEAEAATYAMAVHTDVWERLADVACPVTLGCGGPRAHFGLEVVNALAARLPCAEVDVHADLGHLGPFEVPEKIATAVGDALAG